MRLRPLDSQSSRIPRISLLDQERPTSSSFGTDDVHVDRTREGGERVEDVERRKGRFSFAVVDQTRGTAERRVDKDEVDELWSSWWVE